MEPLQDLGPSLSMPCIATYCYHYIYIPRILLGISYMYHVLCNGVHTWYTSIPGIGNPMIWYWYFYDVPNHLSGEPSSLATIPYPWMCSSPIMGVDTRDGGQYHDPYRVLTYLLYW
jgi:hypothetical protein